MVGLSVDSLIHRKKLILKIAGSSVVHYIPDLKTFDLPGMTHITIAGAVRDGMKEVSIYMIIVIKICRRWFGLDNYGVFISSVCGLCRWRCL